MSGRDKKIVIIEGPAGSGKTTVAEYMALHPRIELIKSSLPNRDPLAYSAVIDSSSNDYSKLSRAIHSPSVGVVIDRLFLSQLVYHALRSNAPIDVWENSSFINRFPKSMDVNKIVDKWIDSMIASANIDLAVRSWEHSHINIGLAWLIILPSHDELTERRGYSDRKFPWLAWHELERYHRLIKLLDNREDKKFTTINGFEDFDVIHALMEWQTGTEDEEE